MLHLVAGRSRSLCERRSLFVRGSPAAKLRQLVFPSRQGLSPDDLSVRGALAATGRCAINWKEAP